MDFKKYFTRFNTTLLAIYFGVFALGFGATYFIGGAIMSQSKNQTPSPDAQNQPPEQVDFGPAPEISKEKGVYNTVLLGYGGAGHAGSLLTDSIIVIHVDSNKKTADLISIPRDLWVSGNHKINAEASINGFQNEGGVIKSVTGLPVDYFVAVDFGGFEKLIDALGGINVDVPKTFDDPYYPIAGLENETCGKTSDEIADLKAKYSDYQLEIQFTCRWEHLHYDKGPATLDGTTALKFVRSRHGDSDFGRSERQFAALKGVLAKLITLKAFENGNSIISSLLKIVKTNLDLAGIKTLVNAVGPTSDYKISEIHLNTDNVLSEGKSSAGAYILYPKAGLNDFSQIKSYINGKINQ